MTRFDALAILTSPRFPRKLTFLTPLVIVATGAVGVYETGVILDETHSWGIAFGVAAGMYAAGGLVYLLFYDASPLFPEGSVHADQS